MFKAIHRFLARRAEQRLSLPAPELTEPTFPNLVSQLCTAQQMSEREYLDWAEFLRCSRETQHRKVWEYGYVMQAVKEALGSVDGKRGLGFGVGQDRLAESFAALGASVVATDQALGDAKKSGWVATGQYASSLEALNRMKICEPQAFQQRVQFRTADMNAVPSDLRDFDFVWSACALEHLGSIERGLTFVERSMQCVRPGGVAVHTTEYNLTSNDKTVDNAGTVLFRRRDLEALKARIEGLGYAMAPLNLHPGNHALDRVVDIPPYKLSPHLRLLLSNYAITSVGIILRRT
jgi:2-polyprenyl-3-methyl-5-hydroxy-6-metoxy-1,4-benzoquinol methylase